MKIRRISAAAAAVAAGALVLTACSSPAPQSEIDETTSVNVSWNQPMFSTNNLTSNGNATANANVIYLMTSFFNYYDGDLNLAKNEDFGTYEVESEDPLVVKYTINDGVTWSDGEPVDAADMILWWGAQNDMFDTASGDDVESGDDGSVTAPEGSVYFDSSSPAMNLITEFPEISDDNKSVTFHYTEPRSDWEVSMSQPSPIAAHAVAEIALGIDDPTEAKNALIDAFKNNDAAALAPISETWNNGFNFTSLPDDERLYLSYGAYIISDYVENQYVTLTKNPDYTWGPEPKVDSITIRYTEDPLAAVTALQNGEVDLIAPQSSVDVLATLEGIDGVSYSTEQEGTYEHVDLTFNNGGPFDPAAYGGDADKALKVRQAFLKTIPRQEIIEKLIQPLQEDATTRDSFTVVPGSPNYDEVVANNDSSLWTDVDIEGAKALLAEAGVTTPVDVRFLYGKSNVRRANEYQLIAQSASQAGFNVIDNGDDNWSSLLGGGTYDASLFGWQSTNTFALNSEANYITDGVNNFGGYSNPAIDELYGQMSTNTDADVETQLTIDIEKQLNADAFGVNIFQFPGVVAHRDVLQGVSTIALSPTIFWNYWDWEISASDSLDAPSATETE
ncbi:MULTISPECIES: ABC transporter family substrate-binding protein [unclassified Cellulomonas]|uniref:ABC transporter family substrate-binding protein n=1 Tax=unclassified Cellulomonas TaxID=2620175 RepID=UPI001C3100EF|nr:MULTISPECIES: ABC transporter family substrate-binding protein [unclassified Cellulomonas]MBW0253829.1 ABC transporter family substrate-binding protein [Cellulomonas sp. PS-H5]